MDIQVDKGAEAKEYRLKSTETWHDGSLLGLRPQDRLRPSCGKCQGVHSGVKRRPLKVGKLSYGVLSSVIKKTTGRRAHKDTCQALSSRRSYKSAYNPLSSS